MVKIRVFNLMCNKQDDVPFNSLDSITKSIPCRPSLLRREKEILHYWIVGLFALLIFSGNEAIAQNTPSSTVTTQITQTKQNSDGSWAVIEYPVNKEVVVELMPSALIPEAEGRVRVLRLPELCRYLD